MEFEHWADGELKFQESIQPNEEMAVALHKMYSDYKSGDTVDSRPASDQTAAIEVQTAPADLRVGYEPINADAHTCMRAQAGWVHNVDGRRG